MAQDPFERDGFGLLRDFRRCQGTILTGSNCRFLSPLFQFGDLGLVRRDTGREVGEGPALENISESPIRNWAIGPDDQVAVLYSCPDRDVDWCPVVLIGS